MNVRWLVALVLSGLIVAACTPTLRADQGVTPPAQPASGPGGREAIAGAVSAAYFGDGGTAYWLFEPADPAPGAAPLVVFIHGWSGIDPDTYGAWIEHIVRRGSIVVYPVYQSDLSTPPAGFTPNAIAAVRDAIGRLQSDGHVSPQLDQFAIVGHSAGGCVSANVAALAAVSGLPSPRALMYVEPGKSWTVSRRIAIPLGDLGRIPSSVLLLAVVGDDDRLARAVDAKRIYRETTAVAADNKDYVTVVSDDHGRPAFEASDLAPCAPMMIARGLSSKRESARGGVDALDYYGFWKLFDALTDAAFFGRNREYALGNTPQQRFMGTWSDGVAVHELVVTDAP